MSCHTGAVNGVVAPLSGTVMSHGVARVHVLVDPMLLTSISVPARFSGVAIFTERSVLVSVWVSRSLSPLIVDPFGIESNEPYVKVCAALLLSTMLAVVPSIVCAPEVELVRP